MKRRAFLMAAAASTCSVSRTNRAQDNNKDRDVPATSAGVADLTSRLNPKIQELRDVALSILKPSERELSRGLQLHSESLVFDAYSFSPRAAVDGDALKAAIEQGASDLELDDLREEMSMTRYVHDVEERKEYLDAWRASGVTCVFQNAGQEGQDPLRLMKRLARFTYATDMLRDVVSKAAIPDDIVQAKQQRRHCLYLTGNGVPLTQQWISVPDELRYLRIFYQMGIRMMHLTYQRRNMIGDGCGEKSDAGLSDFGREVIAEMNRIGVVPDCAHSGWRTSLEAAQASAKPVVASHTTCSALSPTPHARSKPDNVIRAIADTGGYVGICCIPRFLRGTGDINALLDHIDHVVRLFGPDYVAIGTDVAYSSQNTERERKKVPSTRRGRTDFRSLWPADTFQTTPQMTDSVAWTNWPLFTVGLVQRGHSDDTIRKIIGENAMRVANETLRST